MKINKSAYDYFTMKGSATAGNRKGGGASRKWMDRYRKMLDRYEVLEQLLDKRKKEDKAILLGFKMCIDVFHEKVVPKCGVK